MMKNFLLFLFFISQVLLANAQKGYDVKVSFKQPVEDTTLMMGRYYCKLSNTIAFDTAVREKDGSFHFKGNEEFTGGIYWIIFSNKSKKVDFLMDNGYKMEITIDTVNLLKGTVFKGSKDNELMQQYHIEDIAFREKADEAGEQLKKAKTKADSTRIYEEINNYRAKLVEKYKKKADEQKGSMFSLIMNALWKPTPPEGPHYKEDGKTIDSFFNYRYNKAHYWDNFEVWDNRLAFTPLYDEKLKDYFDNYVYPVPDSVQYEADVLLALSKPAPDMFKYTLHWLAYYTRTKKVMGMDESFVYLVDNYYAKGDAFWITDSATLEKNYLEPAEELSYTKLGKVGQDLALHDAYTQMPRNLHSVQADYIILVFWEPACHHCQEEIPAIDSVYKALHLDQKNVVIYSVPQDKSLESIHKMIDQLKVKNPAWLHNINLTGVRANKLYAFNKNPAVFILDKDKKIIGKQINHEAIGKIIDRDVSLKDKEAKN
ncbi:MAG: DUF4369 domain-containing protein [Taibaiella sp.]|nr:DUF4369 domain-containing protein [Taibaiella sp.]